MLKENRHDLILNLIRAKRIGTQEELSAQLEQAGYSVTQSSVSRDLVELGVVKVHGSYTVPQATTPAAQQGLIELDTAGEALVVARCESGLASAVAVKIDRAAIPEIVGTIAGEDTIFVAVRDSKAQRMAIRKIWQLFS
jgi:transcriptional regulator of arginine metabolism